MRHNNNQQGRRFGRNNRNGQGGGGGHNHHNNGGNRRVNPRVQTFDSNGPDVRIRGNAIQITEKYMALARDAAAAGDRVLAESYYQHAEHYQRMLNEAEEFNRQHQQQHQHHQNQQPAVDGDAFVQEGIHPSDAPQPVIPADAGMSDLDQGFLVGPRHTKAPAATEAIAEIAAATGEEPAAAPAAPQRQRRSFRPKEAESA